jgi:hypothetical protein
VAVENEISSTLLQADSQDSNSESGISDPAGNTSDASGSSNRSRTRITAQNPVYGHVEGAMAGPHILGRIPYIHSSSSFSFLDGRNFEAIAFADILQRSTGCE